MQIEIKYLSECVFIAESCQLSNSIVELLKFDLDQKDRCVCVIDSAGIFLEEIRFAKRDGEYPILDGRELQQKAMSQCNGGARSRKQQNMVRCYNDLHMIIPYTGKMLFGKDNGHNASSHLANQLIFVDYYTNSQLPHNYKQLKELIFKRGHLLFLNDHSDVAQFIANQIKIGKQIKTKYQAYDIPQAPNSIPLEMRWKAEWWIVKFY